MSSMLATRLRSISGALTATAEKPTRFALGEWTPDLAQYENPGALVCRNVIPAGNSYTPFRSLVENTNALEGPPSGAIVAKDVDSNIFTYAGTGTKLYELKDNIFTDVSKAGGYTDLNEPWEFATWQREQKVIATNFTNPVQIADAGKADTVPFADMITSTAKPNARHVDIVRSFVVLGNIEEASVGKVPNRVWWSAIADESDFDPAAATQCDFSDLSSGGAIQAIVGGAEYGVIFQEELIRRMEYRGPPVVFEVDPVDRKRGTPIPKSVIGYGRNVFYISQEGFFVFTGSSSEPIGNNRVDKTFWRNFDLSNRRFVSSAIDVRNKLVCWAFASNASAGGLPDTIYCFKWDNPTRWSEIKVNIELLFSAESQGYTLEGLDSVNNNLDLLEPSLDSDVWKGGKRFSAAFSPDHKLGSFDGPTLQATFETEDREIHAGIRTLVTAIRPLVQYSTEPLGSQNSGLSIQCAVGGRSRLDVPIAFDSAFNLNASGEADALNDNRYQRVRLLVGANQDWDHCQGVVAYSSEGARF